MDKSSFINDSKKENIRLLAPKLDVVFHALFREDNKDLLGKLISAVMDEDVKVVTTDKNRYVDTEESEEKLGIMDLRVELEGGIQCVVEIQLQPQQFENERMLYYWADAYKRQALRGKKYLTLNRTISIVILDHEIKELKGIEEVGVKWQIRDEKTGKRVLTDRLEIIIIELPKVKRIYGKDTENKILQWMMFLDNPNKEEVIQIMGVNKDIKKAIEELEQVSGDAKLQRIAELRQKAIWDENAALAYASDNGYKVGLEKGQEEGMKEGKKEGIKYNVPYNVPIVVDTLRRRKPIN